MALILMMGSLVLTSCDDDDDETPPSTTPAPAQNVLSGEMTGDMELDASLVYTLSGRLVVSDGTTLTIPAGTIIKAEAGRGALASALIVARGGKIMAEGTAEAPIIFTSVSDKIEPGMIDSPNLDESFNNLWGGIIILGNAPISADAATEQIEGIPADLTFGQYGGSNVADDSGVLRYVSIRHGGTLIGEGNEINGLTLGGVGNSTVIENIEILANLDDGIEPFGGSVNVTNIVVWAQGDDAYDVDQAYTGTIDNFVYIAGSGSDHGMEIDGPEGTTAGGCTLRNGTLIGIGGEEGNEYADFRDGAEGVFENLYFRDFSGDSDVELDDNAASMNFMNGVLSFSNWEIRTAHLDGGNTAIGDIFLDKSDQGGAFDNLDDNTAKIVDSREDAGADMSVFGWTMASKRGVL